MKTTGGCDDARFDFLLPDGVGPAAGAVASPDLERALDGLTDLAREGVMDTSFEDEDEAGTTVNSGALLGFADGALEGTGLADFARVGFSSTAGKSGNNLWGVPLKGL